MALPCQTLTVPLIPTRNCFSPLKAKARAFLIWILSPTETQPIWSFQRQSLIVPVSSPIKALATTALFPNRVYTHVGSGISKTLASRLTCRIPTRKSLMKLDLSELLLLATYLRTLSVSINLLSGLPFSKRKSSETLNCATTTEASRIKKILLHIVWPLHSIERSPHSTR